MIADEPITLETVRTTFPIGDDPYNDIRAEYSRHAWRCVLCGEWQEFAMLTVNDRSHIVKGCGGSSHFYNGGRIDHCSKPACCKKANELLGISR